MATDPNLIAHKLTSLDPNKGITVSQALAHIKECGPCWQEAQKVWDTRLPVLLEADEITGCIQFAPMDKICLPTE